MPNFYFAHTIAFLCDADKQAPLRSKAQGIITVETMLRWYSGYLADAFAQAVAEYAQERAAVARIRRAWDTT